VVDEWNMSMEHWWSNTARCKQKYLGKNLSQLLFIQITSHVDLSGNRKVPSRWETFPLLV